MTCGTPSYFNPLRPCGRRRKPSFCPLAIERFQSTPPVWAETNHTRSPPQLSCISIHSARVGGDELSDTICPVADGFQSTPPVWAETGKARDIHSLRRISIHSARVGGDFQPWDRPGVVYISIHSARVGGDSRTYRWPCSSSYFNPLRPCGRRPSTGMLLHRMQRISIHSARVGGDDLSTIRPIYYDNFNPLRPCGRRQQKKPFFRLLSISITTYFTEKSKRTRCKFSHLGYLFQYSLLILVRTSLYVDV